MKKILLILIATLSLAFPQVARSQVSQSVINNLQSPQRSLVNQLYAKNGYKNLWIGHPSNLAKATNALSNGYYNYKSKPLHRNEITRLLYALDAGGLSAYNASKLDVLITDAYLRLLHFIRVGDVNWNLVKQKMAGLKSQYDIKAAWEMHVKGMPSASTILKYIKQNRVNALLMQSVGQKARYKSFIDILQYYRKIPEFRKVPYGKVIKYGSRDKRIYQIKRRLRLLGDFSRSGSINRKFDKQLAYAIQRFRKRFNLRAENYIDNKLLAYINRPKGFYIKKILLNLDKTKVFLPSFGSTYIEVNVPEFRMRFYQNGQESFSTNAVVGMITRPTPIFDDYLEYIVTNPTWTVPESLIKKDLIPAIKSHPDVFQIAHLKAYQGGREVKPNLQKILALEGTNRNSPYRIVQQPGPENALGRVKFMFPNKYSVYLHDTPEKGLFNNRYRYNSSGCMRLQDPQGLMDMLLPYTNSRYGSASSAISSGKTQKIRLKHKIPVHIVYFTLEFENGAPKFLFDAYMYDKMIEESTAGNIQYGFDVPAQRLQEVSN